MYTNKGFEHSHFLRYFTVGLTMLCKDNRQIFKNQISQWEVQSNSLQTANYSCSHTRELR